ncbi:MAG: DUF1385 domain-containing protein, partial [Clostridia bacterium]|nr:DUF1385 domain-containing protein [Clostridia bacterium]
MSNKKTSIGGQALIEGIMMRGPKKDAMAVRMKDGGVEVFPMEIKSIKNKCFFFKWPIIRGVVGFIDSMLIGYKAMMDSADKSGYLDELEEAEEKKTDENSRTEEQKAEDPPKKKNGLLTVIMIIAAVLAVILCIGLFIYLPSLAFKGINYLAGGVLTPFQALFEGVLKIIIFLGY